MAKLSKFPKGFYWGASSSAHQVEGGNRNNWTLWEKENAERLAERAKRHWLLWQLELFPGMLDTKNYISGKATDHYNRYKEDFAIAESLGHNMHRFSIEWSRVEPREGKFNEEEIEHYRKVIEELRDKNMEPMVSMWHWTLPLWLEELGGWQYHKTPHYFARYAAKLVDILGRDVEYWITINEPLVYAGNSYMRGDWPPGKKNILRYIRVIRNLTQGHRFAFNAIKVIDAGAHVGVSKNYIYFEAHKRRFINLALKRAADWWWNRYFINNTVKHVDFIGLNQYFRNLINYGFNKNENEDISELGWELYPEAMYHSLKELAHYRKPIFITENGLADSNDSKRAGYIKDVLGYVYKAICEEVDVRGYLHWSLTDNFEWDKGFWPRFGLVEIDYEDNLKRIIRESAKEYAKIIREGGVRLE